MKIDPAIEKCAKLFAGIATDLKNGREFQLCEGPISQAVRASIALPKFFNQAYIDGHWLVQGGLVNPVPISACCALGADIVFVVDFNGDIMERRFTGEPVRPIIDRMTGIPPEFLCSLLNQIPAGIRKQATAIAPRLLQSAPDSPGNFDMLANSINIMQDRFARSRLASGRANTSRPAPATRPNKYEGGPHEVQFSL